MAKITIEELYRGEEYIKTKFELMQVLNAVEVKNG